MPDLTAQTKDHEDDDDDDDRGGRIFSVPTKGESVVLFPLLVSISRVT